MGTWCVGCDVFLSGLLWFGEDVVFLGVVAMPKSISVAAAAYDLGVLMTMMLD